MELRERLSFYQADGAIVPAQVLKVASICKEFHVFVVKVGVRYLPDSRETVVLKFRSRFEFGAVDDMGEVVAHQVSLNNREGRIEHGD